MAALLLSLLVSVCASPINSLDDSTWLYNRCPSQCHCSMQYSQTFDAHMRTVDCSNRELKSMPKFGDIPSDVQLLYLQNNQIRTLPTDALWLPDIQQMNISHNQLQQIGTEHSNMFEGMYNLRQLDVSHNELHILRGNMFQGLFHLERLDLSYNQIHATHNDAFRSLLKLETLILAHNKLQYIHSTMWQHADMLYELDVSHNDINMLQRDSLKSLNNLIKLDVSHNRVSQIDDHTFNELPHMLILDLSHNQLRQVPQKALRPLRPSLKSITIDSNPIQRLCTDDFAHFGRLTDLSVSNLDRLRLVERGALKTLPSLVVVQMHNNPRLGYIDARAFVQCEAVTHLYVHNNNMTILINDTVHSLPNLEELSLYGNPINCDCNMRWLKQRLQEENHIDFVEIYRLVCQAPEQHNFKLFTSLSLDDLPEQCPPRIIDLFDRDSHLHMGDSTVYPCRAVGEPQPKITWLTPEGSVLESSEFHPRRLLSDTSLLLRHVTQDDAGVYTCMAETPLGTAVQHVHLQVTSIDVHLIPVRVKHNSVTIKWAGTDRNVHEYSLIYRNLMDTVHINGGRLSPIMNSYTVTSLLPLTDYELCIALLDDQQHLLTQINCVTIRTLDDFKPEQWSNNAHTDILALCAISLLFFMIILLILVIAHLRRAAYLHRRVDAYDSLRDLEALNPKLHHISQELKSEPNVYTEFIKPEIQWSV